MASFSYRGRNSRGDPVSGLIDAESASAVADQLSTTGVMPTDIQPAVRPGAAALSSGLGGGGWDAIWQRLNTKPIGNNDLMLFARQMGTLQKAGVPILQALSGLQESASNVSFGALLREVRQSLDAGRDLATTLSRYPRYFTEFFVSMVRVGEMTGQLSEIFFKLHDYMQFERDTRERVKAALRYPAFVLIALVLALGIVNIFVIPVFAKVFAQFNAPLPLLTRFLIGMSGFFVEWWALMVALAAGGAWLALNFLRKPAGRLWWGRIKLKLPLAGPIILKTTLARFASSLSVALRAGVPISQSLAVVARTLDNDYFASKVDAVLQSVERGETFFVSVRNVNVFPPMVLQMIAVGEETGELDNMLREVADLYERETDYDIKGLAAAIEPILLSMVAVLVLVLALGIFVPLWSLGQVAMGRGA